MEPIYHTGGTMTMKEDFAGPGEDGLSAHLRVVDANFRRVTETLDRVLIEYPEFCGCPKCRCEVIATALNYLSPHYYVEEEGGGNDRQIFDQSSPTILVENAIRIGIAEVSVFKNTH